MEEQDGEAKKNTRKEENLTQTRDNGGTRLMWL